MTNEIKPTIVEVKSMAMSYAEVEMGRDVNVSRVTVRNSEALALCEAKDGGDDFCLHLIAIQGPTVNEVWEVVDECGADDFYRNAGPMTIALPVVCSTCKKSMGTKDGFASSLAGSVTHGVCPACLPQLRASLGLRS